jgi:AcrR family transcriptional regulator
MSPGGDLFLTMKRDRDATAGKMVQAVGRLLARDGFRSLGLRAVAREAGVDKRLIYRYFGGLPDLIKAYARSEDFWWTVEELVGDHLPGPREDTRAGWMALVLRRHVEALRRRPLTQEILVWELSERNPLTDELAKIRERRARELVRHLGRRLGGSGPATWNAVGALLVAGTTYLVVRSRTFDFYAGVDLRREKGWRQFEKAIDLITSRVFVDDTAELRRTGTARRRP